MQEQKITGAQLIAKERQRQLDVEQWNPEHDAKYENNELVKAAVCYAMPPEGFNIINRPDGLISQLNLPRTHLWPWDMEWWKPSGQGGRIRDLMKAGALIAAEIDRLQTQK